MAAKKQSILIVDDEQVVCDLLYEDLSERGYLCSAVLAAFILPPKRLAWLTDISKIV